MRDTSFLDEINTESRRKKKRVKFYAITGGLILLFSSVSGALFMSGKPGNSPTSELARINSNEPEYEFSYLDEKCSKGMQDYDKVLQQVQTETDKIGGLINDRSWSQNPANIEAAQAVLESNIKVIEVSDERIQKLNSCLTALANKQPFTPEQIADIEAIAADIPKAVQQPPTVAGVSMPTFTYTPYSYRYTSPSFSDSSPTTSSYSTSPSSPTTFSYNTSPAPTIQARTCDEQLKASYTSQYDSDLRTMAARHDREMTSLQERVAASGMTTSGIGQSQIYNLRQQHIREREYLEEEYQRKLQTIYC